MVVFQVIAGIGLLWVITGLAALALHHWGRRIHPRSRMIYAALACGSLFTLLPLAAILSFERGPEAAIPVIATLIGGIFITGLCLPASWWVTRKLERKDAPDSASRAFE
jgi:hypothetical protein